MAVTTPQISDLVALYNKFQNETTYLAQRTRWEADYDLFTLEPYRPKKGYLSYTSNSPSVYADKLISLLDKSKLRIRIPLNGLDEATREACNNTERFCYGCLNHNDERLAKLPDTPSIRQQRAFYAIVRGGFARLAYIYKDEKSGLTIPLIQTWDLYNTAYASNDVGLSWAIYRRPASKDEIENGWGKKLVQDVDEDNVYLYWSTDKMAVFTADEWLLEPTPHGLSYNPVSIHRVGAQPRLYEISDTTGKNNSNIGESCFKNIRGVYPVLNKIVSDLVTIVDRGVKVPLGVWSRDGTVNIEEDIWQTEKAASVPFEADVVVKPLIEPTMPADTGQLLNIIGGEQQRGSLPHTAYGELGFRLSGFAISQLQGSLETVIDPFARCLEQAYKMDCSQLIDQYAGKAWAPIEIRGRTSRNTVFGYPRMMPTSPDMIQPKWYPEVELAPVLPKDDAQRHQLAQLARTPNPNGIPLMADRTIRDDIIGLDDPDLEDAVVAQEWGESRPTILLLRSYLAALADNPNVQTNMKAQAILAELERLMLGAGVGQGQPKQVGTPAQVEQMSMQTPGTGVGTGQTGVSSQVSPPEAMGGYPPGAEGAGEAGGGI